MVFKLGVLIEGTILLREGLTTFPKLVLIFGVFIVGTILLREGVFIGALL